MKTCNIFKYFGLLLSIIGIVLLFTEFENFAIYSSAAGLVSIFIGYRIYLRSEKEFKPILELRDSS